VGFFCLGGSVFVVVKLFAKVFDFAFQTLDTLVQFLFYDGVSELLVEFWTVPAEQAGVFFHSIHFSPNPREVAGLRTVVDPLIVPYCRSFAVSEERPCHSFVFCIGRV